MTLTATYLPDLSRVRLELSDLYPEPNGSVKIERAALTATPPWSTVRGAVALPTFCPDGLSFDGTTGDYASAPDAAALDITGDIDIRCDATVEWVGGAVSGQVLVAKFGNMDGTESYQLGMQPDGLIDFVWSTDGTDVGIDDARSTVPVVPGPGGRLAIRITMDVDNGSGGYTVTFYTAPSIAGPWTELGDPTIGGATTSIFSGPAELAVGGRSNGGAFPPTGTVHAVEVYDGIDGSLVADPVFADEAAGAPSFSDSSGNTWTVNGDAEVVRDVWARVDDYEFYADVQNHYRVLRVDPTPGLFLGGVDGDYASTPGNAALDVTGDIDLRADVTLADWTPGSDIYLVSKYQSTGDQRSYALRIHRTNFLNLAWSTDGLGGGSFNQVIANSALPVSDGERLSVRVTLDVDDGSGNYVARFYHGPSLEGPWTEFSTPDVVAGTTSIHAGTAALTIGGANDGTLGTFAGVVHGAQVHDGINGVVVADPDFAAESSQTTMFIDDAGRTWTVQGNAVIWGEALDGTQTASVTPDLDGETWLKSVKFPFLNRPTECNAWRTIGRGFRGGVFDIDGAALPVAVTDLRASQEFTLEVVTNTLEQARDFDLVLAASGIYFIHNPIEDDSDCQRVGAIPGGYVVFNRTTIQTHALPGTAIMHWFLPARVVKPPSPLISGTTLTWKTVERLYGSWEALWAVNSTWRELWDQIGEPEDAVVF